MYLPKHFKQTDIEEVKGLVACFPLATCVANMGDEFEVNHFPMIWRDDQLIGHIAFANPMHKTLAMGVRRFLSSMQETLTCHPTGTRPKRNTISTCQLGIIKSLICTVNCFSSTEKRIRLLRLDC
jgi:hypothetical protein